MLAWMLKQRGFHYYFAWLTLDFRGIVEDIKMLMSLRLPEAHAGGIAAVIQGLVSSPVGSSAVWWIVVCTQCNSWNIIGGDRNGHAYA
jgi:hypothetical protein